MIFIDKSDWTVCSFDNFVQYLDGHYVQGTKYTGFDGNRFGYKWQVVKSFDDIIPDEELKSEMALLWLM